jgi:hypothetical protein
VAWRKRNGKAAKENLKSAGGAWRSVMAHVMAAAWRRNINEEQ